MKTKQEICVPIRNEEELQQAKEMLEKNGENVYVRRFFISKFKDLNYLILFKDTNTWIVSAKHDLTETPLSELETVLKGENDGTNAYYSFFKFMSDEYNLTLTNTEMSDIIYEAKKVIEKLKND